MTTHSDNDPEIEAMRAVVAALEPLEPDARVRVLAAAARREEWGPPAVLGDSEPVDWEA